MAPFSDSAPSFKRLAVCLIGCERQDGLVFFPIVFSISSPVLVFLPHPAFHLFFRDALRKNNAGGRFGWANSHACRKLATMGACRGMFTPSFLVHFLFGFFWHLGVSGLEDEGSFTGTFDPLLICFVSPEFFRSLCRRYSCRTSPAVAFEIGGMVAPQPELSAHPLRGAIAGEFF